MAVSGSQHETFSPERRVTRVWGSVSTGVAVLSVGSLWLYGTQSLTDKLFLSIVLAILCILSLAYRYRYQIVLDNEGLMERSLAGMTRLRWTEIDDLLTFRNITVIKSSKTNKSISIFHPEEGNIFHSFGAVKDHERLREQILSRVIPYLRKLWCEEEKERVYNFPPASTLLFFIVASPLSIPVLAMIVFGGEYSTTNGWSHFLLFSPFVAVSVYVAYRYGLLSKRGTLVLNDQGILAQNGTKISVTWDQVSCVADNLKTLGLGSIVIRSYHNTRIVIPKSIEKFVDLALRLKKRLPNDKFQVSLGIHAVLNSWPTSSPQ